MKLTSSLPEPKYGPNPKNSFKLIDIKSETLLPEINESKKAIQSVSQNIIDNIKRYAKLVCNFYNQYK